MRGAFVAEATRRQRAASRPPHLTLLSHLSTSRTFQRFAVKSNAMMQEMAKKSAEKQAKLGETAQGFAATFKAEVRMERGRNDGGW